MMVIIKTINFYSKNIRNILVFYLRIKLEHLVKKML